MSAFAFSAESAMAQDSESSSKLEVKAGADLVSAYIWRGARVTGASFSHPSVSVMAVFHWSLGLYQF